MGGKRQDLVIPLTLSVHCFSAMAILGDGVADGDGAVITLIEGQTQVIFLLATVGAISADVAGQLNVRGLIRSFQVCLSKRAANHDYMKEEA